MKASDLIIALEKAISEYGDLEVESDSPIEAITPGRRDVDGKPEDFLYLT